MVKKVSIITINYNGVKDTRELIDSLRAHETYPYELIVVDNASADPNEYRILQEDFPDIRVIHSEKNLGFAGGNNLGITYVTGCYLMLLNNDTIFTRPVLETLVNRLESDASIGSVSPKIACWPQKEILQYVGSTPMSPITLRNENIGFQQIDNGQFDSSHETAFAHGAAMMIRTADLQKFGLMPEFYFLYYEELDWCVQIRRAGFSIRVDPQAIVYHKESASVGKESPLQVYFHSRNRLLFANRSIDNKKNKVCSYLYQIAISFPKRLLAYIAQGKFKLTAALCKGTINGLIAINKDMNYGKYG